MSTTTKGESRSLDQPDEQVEKGGVHIEVVHLGDIKVKRAKYPAGWKFSKDMGADRCQDNHVRAIWVWGENLSGSRRSDNSNELPPRYRTLPLFLVHMANDDKCDS